MNIVFINCTADTFTPTKSGAISTWIWEVCKIAQRDGIEPLVITRRRSDAAPWPWRNVEFLDYPQVPKVKGLGRLLEIQKRVLGWCHILQHIYVKRVADAIRRSGVEKGALVLQNDIELAVYLRRQFPEAFIVHHAQNNNPASLRFRHAFRGSVNVATAVTDFCARWNSEYYGLEVRTLLSGVDVEEFAVAKKAPRDRIVINFVGRTDFAKAPDLLLEAAGRLAQKTKRFAIQILGSNYYDRFHHDEYQQRLAEMSRELEVNGIEIRRPGWITRSQLPAELQKADIHCVPARWDEPFGLTTVEGMACGLATVASRTGGTEQVVGDGGRLFERERADQLAEILAEWIESPASLARWSVRARRRASELTWDRAWSQLKEICQPTTRDAQY